MRQTQWSLTRFTLVILTTVFMSTLSAQPRVVDTPTHRFVEAQDGVWLGTGNGRLFTQ